LTSPNMGSYFGRMYQVKWMAGVLAGEMTKTNRIGVVGPKCIPETVRHINALTRGVRQANPDAVVHVEWIHNWFDPANEPIVTEKLVDAGADIIVSMTDTTIPLEVSATLKTAAGDPVWSIGYDNPDSCKYAPDTCLAACGWNWGPLVARIVQEMAAGTFDPLPYIWEQVKLDPAESIAHLTISEAQVGGQKLVPTGIRMGVEALIPDLAKLGVEGQQIPFKGPVRDNKGEERLKEGEYFADEDLLRMCWYVDGVVGEGAGGVVVPGVVPPECQGDR